MEKTETNEPKIRTNFKELANGEIRLEATARGDTPEEVVELLKETHQKLDEWRKGLKGGRKWQKEKHK